MSVRTRKQARKQTMTKLKSLISELKFKRRAKTSKSTAHSFSPPPLHIHLRSLSHTHLKTPFSSSDLMKFVCIFRFVNKINFLSHGIGSCWWAQRGNDVRACVRPHKHKSMCALTDTRNIHRSRKLSLHAKQIQSKWNPAKNYFRFFSTIQYVFNHTKRMSLISVIFIFGFLLLLLLMEGWAIFFLWFSCYFLGIITVFLFFFVLVFTVCTINKLCSFFFYACLCFVLLCNHHYHQQIGWFNRKTILLEIIKTARQG